MTPPSDREYTVAGFREAMVNGLHWRIAIEAELHTGSGKQFDEAIQAAVQAQDFINSIIGTNPATNGG